MNTIKSFFAFLIIFQFSLFAQTGWIQQNSGTNKAIISSYFVNDFTGYVACNGGLILKTTNGGSQWLVVYNNTIYNMNSVHFINISTGWAVGFYDGSTDTNIVVKTINAGQTWSKSIVDTCYSMCEDIYFLNPLTGYLTGCNLKKTTNGGANWFVVYENNTNGVFFTNNSTGWIGGFGQGIKKTTNAGLNWESQIGPFPHQYNSEIYFHNEQNGFIISGFWFYGSLYTTTNSGINWNPYYLPYLITSITFSNANTGNMLAQSYSNFYITKTTNGGVNWILHNINTTKYPLRLFFSSVNTGWIVGDSGLILKTTNGGVTIGIQPINSEIPQNFSLYQNYPNPFNPNTKIRFDISKFSNVSLIIYDALGKEITTLVNRELKPGTYETDFDGSNLPSGIYFYQMQAGDFSQTKKLILLK